MSLLGDIASALGRVVVDTTVIVVKQGYEIGKATGQGTVAGTAAIVKEVAKKATGN